MGVNSLKNLKLRGVMEAALRVMTRQGAESFSMDDVAEEAGVSKGTLYNYFSSKEELVEASIESAIEPLEAELDRLVESDLPPVQKIQYLTNRLLSYFDMKGEFFRVLLYLRESAQYRYQRYHSEKYQHFIHRLAKVLEEGMDRGQLKRLDPLKTAIIILESNITLINQRVSTDNPEPMEEDARLVTEILLKGITKEGFTS